MNAPARPLRPLLQAEGPSHDVDGVVVLHHVTWADYLRVMRMRGEHSSPRVAYLDGVLQIMSPGFTHESIKSLLGCLVETYCLEREIDFQTVGSWTIKEKRQGAGAEPDECYVFSNLDSGKEPVRPDLAIEVEWTSRLLNNLEIYARLEVREVWVWRKEQLTVHVLRPDGKYRKSQKSTVLPQLDLPQLLSFLDRPTTSRAIRDYRAALRRG